MQADRPLCYSHLTTEQVREALGSNVLLLPIGSLEQHGPHLPLNVDTVIPESLCKQLAMEPGMMLAPAFPYTARSLPNSGGGSQFPGTIHIAGTTLISLTRDVLAAFVHSGAKEIALINGHYENEPFLVEAIELLHERGMLGDVRVTCLSWWSLIEEKVVTEVTDDAFIGWHAEHASTIETSLMLHLRSDLVLDERVDNETPPEAGIYRLPTNPQDVSERGVLYRTSNSSAEVGKALYALLIERLRDLLTSHFSRGRQQQ